MTAPRISTPKVFGRQLALASQFDPLLRNVIPVGVAARFAADSALEGDGFEPSVPQARMALAFEIALSPLRHSRSARETASFCERDLRFETASLQR